jgi:hypothetical protein
MPLYPSEEDCDWLLDQLALVLERLGPNLFLAGPILEPSSLFFPDVYETEAGAVRVVARRLFYWAGREMKIDVDMDHAPDPARNIHLWRLVGHPVREGRLLIEVGEVGRSEHLAGALAHVVSRAIRSAEELDRLRGTPYRGGGEQTDEELEVQLATLTTVALGFGLLSLGAAERVHTGGGVEGNWHSYEVATERHGALAPEDLAFLLAVQLVVRDFAVKGVKRLATHVPANAQKHLLDWFNALTPRRNELIDQLHLPDPSVWPVETTPVEPPAPFPLEPPADLAHPEREKRNWRRPVFRVPEHRGVSVSVFTALFAVVAGTTFRLPPPLFVAFGVIAAAVGYLGGRRMRQDVCSDPGCRARISAGAERCEGCGGFIAGRIAHASQRLEAEERLPASFFVEHELDPPAGDDD